MRSSHSLDRLETAFGDDRLVANAGLLLPATLAQHLGLQQLVDAHLDLGAAPGRANVGDKLLTLIASALAGAVTASTTPMRCAAGGTASVLGCAVKALSTLGTFLRSFRWGHVRQLDPRDPRVARPGLGDRSGTRRSAIHHRPRLDDLRDLWPGEGGRPAPRLHRRARLPPAARGCGRER